MTYILSPAGVTIQWYAHQYNVISTGHLARDIEALRQRRISRRESEAMRACCIEAEIVSHEKAQEPQNGNTPTP